MMKNIAPHPQKSWMVNIPGTQTSISLMVSVKLTNFQVQLVTRDLIQYKDVILPEYEIPLWK